MAEHIPSAAARRGMTVLLVGFTIIFLSSSIKNTFQVFIIEMAESFTLNRGSFAVAASVFMLTFGIASPVVGWLCDRIGPRRTIQVGLLLSGLAFLGCATSPSFGVFVVLYGVVAAFGLTAMSYVPMGLLVDQSFAQHRKGLAYATLTNGASIGFIVLSPVWVYSQDSFAWQQVYLALGAIFLLPLLLLAQMYLPDGPAKSQAAPAGPPLRFRERLTAVTNSKPFYALAFGFFGCGVTMAFIDVHMVAHFHDMQLGKSEISIAMGILGVTELAGGFVAGWLCDRYPKAYVIAGFYLLRAAALLALLIVPGVAGSWVFAAVFGFSYLGTVIGTSMYTLGLFGAELKGFAFGLIWLVHQLGAFLSTQLGANAFDLFGSYHWTVLATGLVAVLSFLISLLLLPPNPIVEGNASPDFAKAQ